MKSLRQIIERVRVHRDQAWALATLVETRGSTYRKAGARMLVDQTGGYIGVLSGGCLEEEIARRAVEVIEEAPPALVEFDTRRLYGCNGLVRILVERVEPAGTQGNFLTQLGNGLEHRQCCRLRTCFRGDREPHGTTMLAPAELVAECDGAFIHAVPLPVRLLLFGNGPEIAPLREFSQALGWVVYHFTNASELADHFLPDTQTAALVMTHQFGRDLSVLDRLLPLKLPYIGLLGPRKRHWQLLQELHTTRAPDPDRLAALHAPAGLDVGSESPEEIALSIVSEVCAVLANRHGGHLRNRTESIHMVSATALEQSA